MRAGAGQASTDGPACALSYPSSVPAFDCTVCGARFTVPQAALDKYAGWEPRYCREHSPQRARALDKPNTPAQSVAKSRGSVGRGRSLREANLTTNEVLDKFTDGPETGVFTDGGSAPNPGPGGWGVVWVKDGEIQAERYGHDPDTTNNRMELMALTEAFKLLPEDAEVEVFSDSRLCVQTITEWAPGWERRGWKKKSGPIKNLELVQQLLRLYRAHPRCTLKWTAAHSGTRWNEYADSLSTAWMRDKK